MIAHKGRVQGNVSTENNPDRSIILGKHRLCKVGRYLTTYLTSSATNRPISTALKILLSNEPFALQSRSVEDGLDLDPDPDILGKLPIQAVGSLTMDPETHRCSSVRPRGLNR